MTYLRAAHSLFRLAPSFDSISTLSFRYTGFRVFLAARFGIVGDWVLLQR